MVLYAIGVLPTQVPGWAELHLTVANQTARQSLATPRPTGPVSLFLSLPNDSSARCTRARQKAKQDHSRKAWWLVISAHFLFSKNDAGLLLSAVSNRASLKLVTFHPHYYLPETTYTSHYCFWGFNFQLPYSGPNWIRFTILLSAVVVRGIFCIAKDPMLVYTR